MRKNSITGIYILNFIFKNSKIMYNNIDMLILEYWTNTKAKANIENGM